MEDVDASIVLLTVELSFWPLRLAQKQCQTHCSETDKIVNQIGVALGQMKPLSSDVLLITEFNIIIWNDTMASY
jgi:hypothetical protein